jgi:uncharacterized protein (DUF1499 family)
LNVWQVVLSVIALIAAALAGVFLLVGPERIWTLFGPADLGPVMFESLRRRTAPNDALACPPDLCPAQADIVPPVFAVAPSALREAFSRAMLTERRLTLVDIDDRMSTERYVQRSEKMRFPDTIVVRFLERPGERSTVAIYSRSQLGEGDMGVNRARIERWLQKLSQEVSAIKRG